MRPFLALLLAQLTFFGLKAQQVSGYVKDAQGTPVSAATVSLLKASDSSVVKLAVSKESGFYIFSGIKTGNYRVSVTHVGFNRFVSAPVAVTDGDITVPDLQLSKASGDMKGIVVTAQKPVVEVKADKMILNVEGTINATGSDALELLRKSPGVSVDKDENLSVSGKNGVQVYIDGRPTPLTGSDLSAYLKTLQSNQIEAIEIISNPSAKYEAAGNAGIINIRLKKDKSLGANGTVNAGWNIGTYAKYFGGASLNYRNRKINIFGNYNINKGINEFNMSLYRITLDTLFDSHNTFRNDNISHNFKAGADFFLNKKSTLGVMVNGTLASPEINNNSKTTISYVPTNETDRILVANNTSDAKRNNVNANLNYSYNGAEGKSLVLNGDYGYYDIKTDQYQPNTYYDPTGQHVISQVNYEMIAPTKINISSLKADYEQNLGKGKLGFGGKVAYIDADNDFQRYNVNNGVKDLDKDRSNTFTYKENINALYVNYNRAFKGFILQAGLRAENTNTKGVSQGLKNTGSAYEKYDSTFTRNYTDLFPSAAITFNKNPKSVFNLTYSRRIDRPAYQDLNPFEFKLDEYTYQKGNIDLRPQYTNSIGLTHTYKFRLNTTLNYSHVKDMFAQIGDTIDRSKAFVTKRNLAQQEIISLNVSYPFSYKSYTVFANVNTFYSKYKADLRKNPNETSRLIDLGAFGLNFYAQNTLKFAKTWTAELTGFYNAPTVYQGTLKAKSMFSIDGGLQKQIMKGKATVKGSVSDIFHTMRFRGTSEFAGQYARINGHWESRQFKLSLIYRFGSNQVKAARQRSSGAEDELKRTQSSSGTPGIGQ